MRRHATGLLAVVIAATGLSATACNAGRRELTIVFTPQTSADQRAAAQRACTGVAPHTSPEPIPTPTGTRGIERTGPLVRFRIDVASDRDIARLEECLEKQVGVQGFQDSAA